MPKMKSHKASRRRLRLTRNGKVVRTTAGVRHLMADRSPKTKRQRRRKSINTNQGIVKRARFALSANCNAR
ncbi:MAG: 50S ribosomal protein L35 [Planctomycetota bacterium]|nr:50S ribosomal protein L35 [Planctomycetota bacterium]MCX8040447.1 50S ribosomal protein L35 [Planctomycetota bacterium]